MSLRRDKQGINMPETQIVKVKTGNSGRSETVLRKSMRAHAASFLLREAAVTLPSQRQVRKPELC